MASANPPIYGKQQPMPQQQRAAYGQVGKGGPAPPPAAAAQMGSPTKEINTAQFCRIGQETVQDIVARTSEAFQLLKTIQLPNNVNPNLSVYQERKAKVEEQVRTLTHDFKRLRFVYNKVCEDTRGMDEMDIEGLLPVEENGEVTGEEPVQSEAYNHVSQEQKELIEQLQMKNRQLKEIIDQLRTLVWEINTMMAMRKV